MGNSQHTAQPDFVRPYNQADWQVIQRCKDHQVWQHTHTHQKYLVYSILLSEPQTQHALQIYHFRQLNHFRLVTPHAILQDNQTFLCSSSTPLHLLVEYIPLRLADINTYLSFEDRLSILAASFAALQTLNYVYGPLFVSEDTIAFNEQGQIKLWVNEMFSSNQPSLRARGMVDQRRSQSESRIEQKLLNCVTEVFRTVGNWQLEAYPADFRTGAAGVSNFSQGEQFINNYCRKKGIELYDSVPIWQYFHNPNHNPQLPPDRIRPRLLSQRTSQLSKLRESAQRVYQEPFQVEKPLSLEESVVKEHLYGTMGKSERGGSFTGQKIKISYGKEIKSMKPPTLQPAPIQQAPSRINGRTPQLQERQQPKIDHRVSLMEPARINPQFELPLKTIISYQIIDSTETPSFLETYPQSSTRPSNYPVTRNSPAVSPLSPASTSHPTEILFKNTRTLPKNTIYQGPTSSEAKNQTEPCAGESESRELAERSLGYQQGNSLRLEREEPQMVQDVDRGSSPLPRVQQSISDNGSVNVLDDIKIWQASMLLKISNKGNSYPEPEVLATSQVDPYNQTCQPQQFSSNFYREKQPVKQECPSNDEEHKVSHKYKDIYGPQRPPQTKNYSYHHDLYSFGPKPMDNFRQEYREPREELFLKFKQSSKPKRKPSCDFRVEDSPQLELPSYETNKYTTFGKIDVDPLSIYSNTINSKRQCPNLARTNLYPTKDYLRDPAPENQYKYLTEGSVNCRKPSKTTYNKMEERYHKYVLNKTKRRGLDSKSSLQSGKQDTSFQSSKERLHTWVDYIKESRAKGGNIDRGRQRNGGDKDYGPYKKRQKGEMAQDRLKTLLRN